MRQPRWTWPVGRPWLVDSRVLSMSRLLSNLKFQCPYQASGLSPSRRLRLPFSLSTTSTTSVEKNSKSHTHHSLSRSTLAEWGKEREKGGKEGEKRRRGHGGESEQRSRLRRGLRGAAQEAGPREPQAPGGEHALGPFPSRRMTDQSMDAPSLFFLSSLPISAGSSIDLFLFLTLAPVFSAQDLGIKEMSKSLLQAARLQKQNKVLAARTPLAPRARALRASDAVLSCCHSVCRPACARAPRRGRSSTPPRCGVLRGRRPRFPTRTMWVLHWTVCNTDKKTHFSWKLVLLLYPAWRSRRISFLQFL